MGSAGKPYSAQGAKSGQFAYYVCASLFREGAGACTARYLNATKVEDLVIEKVLDFVRLDGGIEPEGVTRTKDHRRVTVGVSIWPALAGLTPH